MTEADVKWMFEYHQPTEEQISRISAIRKACIEAGNVILANTPGSPDQTAAIRKLHEAMTTANKAIVLERPVG